MKDFLKIAGCWASFVVSLFAGGFLLAALHLHMNQADHRTAAHFAAVLIAGAVLVAGLYPMARGLAASTITRIAAVTTFLVVAMGINTMLEAEIFTTVLEGAHRATAIFFALLAVFTGVPLGAFFGAKGVPQGLAKRPLWDWAGRGFTAWIGFPLIYLVFGLCVAPIVKPYYGTGIVPGFHIPGIGIILGTQLVRSLLFLGCSLPLIALWSGTRRGLWLSLGLAHAVTVGLFGLIANTTLPAVLRWTHGIEITVDSFVYAGLLALLFVASSTGAAKLEAVPPRETHV